jgi:hypothetical protein
MTPKEKAIELVSKFKPYADYTECDIFNQIERMHINAKNIALIAVDEIINNIKPIEINQLITSFKSAKDFDDNLVFIDKYITKNLINEKLYFQEIKQEIEKL